MYDLPLLVVSTRRKRRQNVKLAAAHIGCEPTILTLIESGYGCDVQTLILLLDWMETD